MDEEHDEEEKDLKNWKKSWVDRDEPQGHKGKMIDHVWRLEPTINYTTKQWSNYDMVV
jgi:hypothetical protein